MQGKIERLRSPTDFADLAGRADNIHRELQRGGNPSGIDHYVKTVSIAQRSSPRDNVFTFSAEGCRRANLFGHLQSTRIHGTADDNDLAGAGQLCHPGTEETDRPRADDRYCVASENTGIAAPGVVTNTPELGQA